MMHISTIERTVLTLTICVLTASCNRSQVDSTNAIQDTNTRERQDSRENPAPLYEQRLELKSNLSLLLQSANRKNFQDFWSEMKAIPNDDGQQDSLRKQAIEKLVELTSIEEAIAFISQDSGPGAIRNQMIEYAFDAARRAPTELLVLMENLPSEPERDAARLSLEYRAGKGDFPLDTFDDVTNLTETSFAVFRAAIKFQLSLTPSDSSRSGRSDESTKSIMTMISEFGNRGVFDTEQANFLMLTIAEKKPFELWGEFSSNRSDSIAKLCAPILSQLVENMVIVSPEETMNLIGLRNSPSNSTYASAIKVWMARDSTSALKWYAENSSTLNPEAEAAIEMSITQHQVNQGDLESARKYMAMLKSPEDQRKAEGWIWQSERASLRSEIAKDPEGTLKLIVSGQSNYGDYWLEEAVGTWVAKDFDKANEWYQQNWKSLPASKSQYVAAAFAKQAMGQGDTATAKQWADLIQDAKTKDRINAQITKSEAGQKQ